MADVDWRDEGAMAMLSTDEREDVLSTYVRGKCMDRTSEFK